MTEPSSGEPIEAVLAQLRAEESVEQDASQRALLRHEAGVLEESRGRSDEAMADYLAAHDADREFRQPLLAIIRLLWGKQAAGEAADDLGELLERAIDLADTAGGTASALWELAIHRAHVGEDRAAALAYLEQAVEQNPDDVAAWLELELLAAREGATDLRLRALEARASLTNDPSWQGLLLTELALLCAGAGDTARAASLLDTVAGLEGRARFRSRLALESVARAAGDDELLAHAVEGQAELITLALDDPDDAGSWGVGRAGVPRR
ncbi:MAG: hypothetical protein KC731_14365, partial [Myxococcales bacterium]|nr:hypothetical protein [Myxococcales bacterium]